MRFDAYRHTASHILAHLYRAGAAKSSSSAALEERGPPRVPLTAERVAARRMQGHPRRPARSRRVRPVLPLRSAGLTSRLGASPPRRMRGDPEWLTIALGFALTAAALAVVAPSIL